MGNLITAISDLFTFQQNKRLLLLGLDAAGKTTLLYKLRLGETVHTIPTVSSTHQTKSYIYRSDSTSKLYNTKTSVGQCGILVDKKRFVLSGNTIT
jgi:GTPase SAR1 family protein